MESPPTVFLVKMMVFGSIRRSIREQFQFHRIFRISKKKAVLPDAATRIAFKSSLVI